MVRDRVIDRRPVRALAAAALAVLVGTVPMAISPTLARDPHTALRPDRAAWDRASGRAATGAEAGHAPARYIVRYRSGMAPTQRRLAVAHPGLRHVHDLRGTDLSVVEATGDPAVALRTLQADPRVASVEVDHQNVLFDDPEGETYWSELWGMNNTGQRLYQGEAGTQGTANVDIDEPEALAVTNGSADVVVAVIDDGVDFSHPDLADRAWTNPGESGGGKETNGIDDDHDGYVDDVHGWDFCHEDNTVHHFAEDFHGTHVAGTIAASLDGEGVVGVAPNVKIMALKFIDGSRNCGLDDQAIAAINYAKHFGVRIANASWGGYADPRQLTSLRNAIATSGMLFVAAAGNDGVNNDRTSTPALPASFDLPNVVSVAAVDNRGVMPGFSNYGKKTVDLAAPGVAILSTLPADEDYPNPGWGWLDGTSMAAPHVAGVAALILSRFPTLGTNLTTFKARLLGAGKSDGRTTGRTATGRIVDAYRALDDTPPSAAPPSAVGFLRNSVLGRTTTTARVSWAAATDDLTGISGYGVQAQVDGRSWGGGTSSTTARTLDWKVSLGHHYGFRDRARDGARNWGEYAEGPTVTPTIYQSGTSLATYHGSWGTSRNHDWSTGRTAYSRHAGASVTFRFTGSAVAIVSPKGPTRGAFKLYVDGHYVATYDTHRSSQRPRVVVATKTWTSPGPHTVKLVVVGTKGHPRVDVDAFLVMR